MRKCAKQQSHTSLPIQTNLLQHILLNLTPHKNIHTCTRDHIVTYILTTHEWQLYTHAITWLVFNWRDSQICVSARGYGGDRYGMMGRRRLSDQRVDDETCGHLVHGCSAGTGSNHMVTTTTAAAAIVASNAVGRIRSVDRRLQRTKYARVRMQPEPIHQR